MAGTERPDYFQAKAGPKKVGRYTWADVGIEPGDANADRALLVGLPPKNVSAKAKLLQSYEELFGGWAFELQEGFNLLMIGFGSKQDLLQRFAEVALTDGGVLLVHGLRRGATPRQLMQRATAMLCDMSLNDIRGINMDSLLLMIQRDTSGRRLYIILHNIDGPGFRSSEAQGALSALAACERVHLVASFDHVNTPLLWDAQLAARFNWLWHDVTTYAPYVSELNPSSVPSLLAARIGERVESGAAIVLRAMVPKAREVFRIIAEEQLGDLGGVEFQRLFKLCRQKFLVSVPANLKAHLAEFRDHQLVQNKRGEDGVDLLFVPLAPEGLQSVLEDMMTEGDL